MTLQEWVQKNQKAKRYAHFDKRVSLKEILTYISEADNISHHGFYPFIHYTKVFNKYSNGKIKKKERELNYSAHIDRYIYSYYGFLLNQKYNDRVFQDGLNDVSLAYRDNLGKNNIHFAKSAVDKIREIGKCYIIVGDFTNFFDQLDHKYLKDMLCDLLQVKLLPDDYYAVFKNITKYSKWELIDILNYYGLAVNEKGIKELNEKDVVFTLKEFKRLKKIDQNNPKPNKNNYGIPQGSAISAVLSNIYMLKCDKILNDYVKKYNGLYMRYSDDFIIVLPKITEDVFKEQFQYINTTIKSIPYLILQPDKTQVFCYTDTCLISCNTLVMPDIQNRQNRINYLGFTFDGKEVTIRDKTITKYYYRMYRKLKTIVKNNGITKNGNRISCENVYYKYSSKGARIIKENGQQKNRGNFITYVQRAEKIWGPEEPINRSTKNHLLKIRRQLDKLKQNG